MAAPDPLWLGEERITVRVDAEQAMLLVPIHKMGTNLLALKLSYDQLLVLLNAIAQERKILREPADDRLTDHMPR